MLSDRKRHNVRLVVIDTGFVEVGNGHGDERKLAVEFVLAELLQKAIDDDDRVISDIVQLRFNVQCIRHTDPPNRGRSPDQDRYVATYLFKY